MREMLNKYLCLLMYLSMTNRHIMYVESEGNVFNDSTFFNTNACSCNGDVLMNLNVVEAW
jgi:hypothetical protein